MPFLCTICEEESTRICVRCTKDACANHLCDRCGRCSDCCECEVFLDEPVREPARSVLSASLPPRPAEAEPEPPQESVEPDPTVETDQTGDDPGPEQRPAE